MVKGSNNNLKVIYRNQQENDDAMQETSNG